MKFFWRKSKRRANASNGCQPADNALNAEGEQTSASALEPQPEPSRAASPDAAAWKHDEKCHEGNGEAEGAVQQHPDSPLLEMKVVINGTVPQNDEGAGSTSSPAAMQPQIVFNPADEFTHPGSLTNVYGYRRDQKAASPSFQHHQELKGLQEKEPALAGELGWDDVAPVSKWNVDFSRLSGARRALRAASLSTSCGSSIRSSSDDDLGSPPSAMQCATVLPDETAPLDIGKDLEETNLVELDSVELSTELPVIKGPASSLTQVRPASSMEAQEQSAGRGAREVLQEDGIEDEAHEDCSISAPTPVPLIGDLKSAPKSASKLGEPLTNGVVFDGDRQASRSSSGQSFETLLEDVLHLREVCAQRAAASLVEAARLESVLHAARSYSSAQALTAVGPPQQAMDIMLTLYEQLTTAGRERGSTEDLSQRHSLAGAWVEAAVSADLASPPTLLKKGASHRTMPGSQRSEVQGGALLRGRVSLDSVFLSNIGVSGSPNSRQQSPRLLGSVTTVAAPPRTPPLSRMASSKQAEGNGGRGLTDGDTAMIELLPDRQEGTAGTFHASSENVRSDASRLVESCNGKPSQIDRLKGFASQIDRLRGFADQASSPSSHRQPDGVTNGTSCSQPCFMGERDAAAGAGCALQRRVRVSIEGEILTLLERMLSVSQSSQTKGHRPHGSSSRQAVVDSFALLHRSDCQLAEMEFSSPDLTTRQQAVVGRKRIAAYVTTRVGCDS